MKQKQFFWPMLSGVFAFVNACAPGKGPGAGIGCSKTTSIMKTSQIRDSTDPFIEPSDEQQRNRVIKLFGTEDPMFTSGPSMFAQSSTGGLKSAGGYIYVQTRAAGDPLGPTKNKYSRCSVLVEFPKNTGERLPPESTASGAKFPSTLSAIDAFRFPSPSESISKGSTIRIFTAAHCLDFSVNESVILSLFKEVENGELLAPGEAYVDLHVQLPELEGVKALRKEIKARVLSDELTREDGERLLNAFRPMARNLDKIFGSNDSSTPRGKCNFKPETIASLTEQYSCATYHDLAVLDVQIDEALTPDKIDTLKDIRNKWVTDLKAEEAKGPWVEYVKPPFNNFGMWNQSRFFIDSVMSEISGSGLKTDAAKTTHPEQCVGFPEYKFSSACVDIAPIHNPPFPDIPGFTCPRNVSRLGLFRPTPNNCLEVPLTSEENLHYVRYITRERLRNFSRYNMVTYLKEIQDGLSTNPLNLHMCGSKTSGVCALKDEVETALSAMVPGLGIAGISDFQNQYDIATDYVNASLSAWEPFFDVAANIDSNLSNADAPSGNFDASLLKEIINPVDFLKLHSNVVILDNSVLEANYPSADNESMHRAFMMLPMPNIIGHESYFSASGPIKPIGIDNWSAAGAGSGKGKFLRLFVTKSDMEAFFESLMDDSYNSGLPSGMSVPPPGTVFLNSFTNALMWPLPTKIFLQKGDSGSIFTLDSIPAFALSTVNGEPTSGGAAVRGVPPDLMDDGVPIRVAVGPGSGGGPGSGSGAGSGSGGTGSTTANNGGDGPGAAAGSSGGGPAGGSVAAVATCK